MVTSDTRAPVTERPFFAPQPALGLLIRLKFRAGLRRRLRGLRKPSGAIFAFLGFCLFCLWMLTMMRPGRGGWPAPDPELLRQGMQLVLAFFSLIVLSGAINTRGLYFPPGECERLFSAPLAPRDLVRYRVVTDLGRALLSAVIFALISRRSFENPVFGAAAIFLALMTMSLLRHGAALLLANPKGILSRLTRGRRLTGLSLMAGVGAFFTIQALIMGARGETNFLISALAHPVTEFLLLPFRPWAELATASGPAPFGIWMFVCVAFIVVLYRCVTGFDVEYREASLETSQFIAGRLRRLGKGGGRFALAGPTRGKRERGIPYFFGRGPFGGAAHLQLTSMLRRPLSTYALALFVIGLVTLGASMSFSGSSREEGLGGSLMIVLIGTIYLCGGIRFDFRSNLDHIGEMKTWPLSAATLFLATVLPQALLICSFLMLGVVVRAVVAGGGGVELAWVMTGTPFLVLTWMGLDNALFLLFPVRFTPGQDGAMQHVGRTLALLSLRLVAFTFLAAVTAAVAFGGHWIAGSLLGAAPTVAMTVGWLGALGTMGAFLVPLILLGGWMLRRFDPSRLVTT
jgi:hypothetical protein